MNLQGSGLSVEHLTGLEFTCEVCEHENTSSDGYRDDWGTLYGVCENCPEHSEIKYQEDDTYDSDNDYYEG